MKSLLVGIGCYLCKVDNYHDSRACGYKRSGILPRIEDQAVGSLESPCGSRCVVYFLIQLNWVV
jgi:hypothetical protein